MYDVNTAPILEKSSTGQAVCQPLDKQKSGLWGETAQLRGNGELWFVMLVDGWGLSTQIRDH